MDRNPLPIFCAAIVYAVAASSAQAAPFLVSCAPNGVLLDSELTVGYDDPLTVMTPVTIPPAAPGADVVRTLGPTTLVVAPSPPSGISTAGPITRAPIGGGGAKDLVVAQTSSEFEYSAPLGTPGSDTFRLRAYGSGSAVSAFDAAGVAADAYVASRVQAEFYNEATPTSAPPPTNCNGQIALPPLRALAPYEVTLQVSILEQIGGVGPINLVYTHNPGAGPANITLQRGARYQVVLDYELRVPHGIDPPFDADVTFTVTSAAAVPSASAFGRVALILLSMLVGTYFVARSGHGRPH